MKRKTPARAQARRFRELEKHIKPATAWRPYQLRFINDPSRFVLWVKSAQIGGSSALGSWSLSKCITKPKELVVILSASERQAKEVAHKIKDFIDALGGVDSQLSESFFEKTDTLVHTIEFPNRSRIIALPARPETARGYTGHVILDEFAHAADDKKIFTAVYRQVTLGYDMRVVSTPNGQQGRFWQMAKELKLDLGKAPERQPTRNGVWSGHWTDIYLAVREGLPVDPEAIRAGCDLITWQQEYLCQFLAENALWLSPELIESNLSRDATTGSPPLYLHGLYAGWDVARNGHHSTIWFNQLLGDVSVCRGLVNITGQTTPVQIEQVRVWLPQVAKMNIDMTGMGLTIAETLHDEYPMKCEGVTFTAPIKEQLAVYGRMRLEQRKVRLPNDEIVRRSFLSLRRSTNKIGQARFDADADEKFGHADEFWAWALAEMAAERGVSEAASRGENQSSILFDAQAKGPLSNFMRREL